MDSNTNTCMSAVTQHNVKQAVLKSHGKFVTVHPDRSMENRMTSILQLITVITACQTKRLSPIYDVIIVDMWTNSMHVQLA